MDRRDYHHQHRPPSGPPPPPMPPMMAPRPHGFPPSMPFPPLPPASFPQHPPGRPPANGSATAAPAVRGAGFFPPPPLPPSLAKSSQEGMGQLPLPFPAAGPALGVQGMPVGGVPMLGGPSTPIIFAGDFVNRDKADGEKTKKADKEGEKVHELHFQGRVFCVEGIHVVPDGVRIPLPPTHSQTHTQAHTLLGKTQPDLQSNKAFTVRLVGRHADTQRLETLFTLTVRGGVQWMPLPSPANAFALDYLAITGDFDALTLILHGQELSEQTNKNALSLPPYPRYLDYSLLPEPLLRPHLERLQEEQRRKLEAVANAKNNSSKEKKREKGRNHYEREFVCLAHDALSTEISPSLCEKLEALVGRVSYRSEHALAPLDTLADLVGRIFSLSSTDAQSVSALEETTQQLRSISEALSLCWKPSHTLAPSKRGSVREIVGEDGANYLCASVVKLLRDLYDPGADSEQARFLRSLSEKERACIHPLGIAVLKCVRLILVNEFMAREFLSLGGCTQLSKLLQLSQQIAFPLSLKQELFFCLLESVDKDGFSAALQLSSESAESYQTLLYLMASMKQASPLTAPATLLVNLLSFAGELREWTEVSMQQKTLAVLLPRLSDALRDLYAVNDQAHLVMRREGERERERDEDDVNNNNNNKLNSNNSLFRDGEEESEEEKTDSPITQTIHLLLEWWQDLSHTLTSLLQSWKAMRESFRVCCERERHTMPVTLRESEREIVQNVLHNHKFLVSIATLTSAHKLVCEFVTLVDCSLSPQSYRLRVVAEELQCFVDRLCDLALLAEGVSEASTVALSAALFPERETESLLLLDTTHMHTENVDDTRTKSDEIIVSNSAVFTAVFVLKNLRLLELMDHRLSLASPWLLLPLLHSVNNDYTQNNPFLHGDYTGNDNDTLTHNKRNGGLSALLSLYRALRVSLSATEQFLEQVRPLLRSLSNEEAHAHTHVHTHTPVVRLWKSLSKSTLGRDCLSRSSPLLTPCFLTEIVRAVSLLTEHIAREASPSLNVYLHLLSQFAHTLTHECLSFSHFEACAQIALSAEKYSPPVSAAVPSSSSLFVPEEEEERDEEDELNAEKDEEEEEKKREQDRERAEAMSVMTNFQRVVHESVPLSLSQTHFSSVDVSLLREMAQWIHSWQSLSHTESSDPLSVLQHVKRSLSLSLSDLIHTQTATHTLARLTHALHTLAATQLTFDSQTPSYALIRGEFCAAVSELERCLSLCCEKLQSDDVGLCVTSEDTHTHTLSSAERVHATLTHCLAHCELLLSWLVERDLTETERERENSLRVCLSSSVSVKDSVTQRVVLEGSAVFARLWLTLSRSVFLSQLSGRFARETARVRGLVQKVLLRAMDEWLLCENDVCSSESVCEKERDSDTFLHTLTNAFESDVTADQRLSLSLLVSLLSTTSHNHTPTPTQSLTERWSATTQRSPTDIESLLVSVVHRMFLSPTVSQSHTHAQRERYREREDALLLIQRVADIDGAHSKLAVSLTDALLRHLVSLATGVSHISHTTHVLPSDAVEQKKESEADTETVLHWRSSLLLSALTAIERATDRSPELVSLFVSRGLASLLHFFLSSLALSSSSPSSSQSSALSVSVSSSLSTHTHALSVAASSEPALALLSLQMLTTLYRRLEETRAVLQASYQLQRQREREQPQFHGEGDNKEKENKHMRAQHALRVTLSALAVSLVETSPALLLRFQESLSVVQQVVCSLQTLPVSVYAERFFTNLSLLGQGFNLEFLAIKLWIAAEEGFQYLQEATEIRRQLLTWLQQKTERNETNDTAPFTEEESHRFLLEAHAQFFVAIHSLQAVLDLLVWGYEAQRVSLSVLNRAMRFSLADPKKVVIRFQRAYTMWMIAFLPLAEQCIEYRVSAGRGSSVDSSSHAENNAVVSVSAGASLFSHREQTLFDARHSSLAANLRSLVEIASRAVRYYASKEERIRDPVRVCVSSTRSLSQEQCTQLLSLLSPAMSENSSSSDGEITERAGESSLVRPLRLPHMSAPSSLHVCVKEAHRERESENFIHSNLHAQMFHSLNGVDSSFRPTEIIVEDVLQALDGVNRSHRDREGEEEDSLLRVIKRRRLAAAALPQSELDALDRTVFAVLHGKKEKKTPSPEETTATMTATPSAPPVPMPLPPMPMPVPMPMHAQPMFAAEETRSSLRGVPKSMQSMQSIQSMSMPLPPPAVPPHPQAHMQTHAHAHSLPQVPPFMPAPQGQAPPPQFPRDPRASRDPRDPRGRRDQQQSQPQQQGIDARPLDGFGGRGGGDRGDARDFDQGGRGRRSRFDNFSPQQESFAGPGSTHELPHSHAMSVPTMPLPAPPMPPMVPGAHHAHSRNHGSQSRPPPQWPPLPPGSFHQQ